MTTLLEKLQAQNLPVISAEENGDVRMGQMTPEQEAIYNNILLEHFQPASYSLLQANSLNVQDLKEQYQTAINRLDEIINSPNPGVVNLNTILAIVQAVKDMALIQKRTLKALKAILG